MLYSPDKKFYVFLHSQNLKQFLKPCRRFPALRLFRDSDIPLVLKIIWKRLSPINLIDS